MSLGFSFLFSLRTPDSCFHASGVQKLKAVALDVDPVYFFWPVVCSGSWQLDCGWELVGRIPELWLLLAGFS